MRIKLFNTRAWPRFISLQTKLTLSHLLIAFLPTLIISAISYHIYSNSTLTETTARMESLVVQTNKELDSIFDAMRTLLLAAYSSSEMRKILYNPRWNLATSPAQKVEDYQKINDFFRGILFFKKNIAAIRLLPVQGISIIWHKSGGLMLGYPHPDIPWQKQIVAADINEAFIAPHQPLPPSNPNQNEVFSIGKIIRDLQGNISSTILIDVNSEEINELLDRAGIINKLQLALLDQHNQVIFKSANLQTDKFVDLESLRKIQHSRKGRLQYKVNGEKYLLIYNTSGISGWKLIAFTKISVLLAKAYRMRVINLVIGLSSIALSILLAILLSLKLTSPLKRLSASMEDVKNKNFDVCLPVSSNDELGMLTSDFNSMVSRIKDLIVSEYEADVKRKDAELKALEAQINPHFLYNTLETMNSIAYLKGVPEIATITRSLSQLFRYSIDSTKKQVTIADEIFYTTNYINIQKIRYGDTFKVIYRIDAALMEYKVIKLIFQPLIENALIHGLESLKSGGVIVVGAKLVSDQTLVIEVVDNGVGIMPEKLAAIHKSLSGSSDDVSYKITRSIGLANVHFRVRHFYGKKYGLTIANNSEGGVKVTLTIPAIR